MLSLDPSISSGVDFHAIIVLKHPSIDLHLGKEYLS